MISEARSKHHIQLLRLQWRDHPRHVRGGVLAIGVEGHKESSPSLREGVRESRCQGGTLAQIPDVPEKADVEARGLRRRVVCRSVIHHYDPVWKAHELGENIRQRDPFIVRRHNDADVRPVERSAVELELGLGQDANTLSHIRSTLAPVQKSLDETGNDDVRLHPMITAERLDPLLTATGSSYDREALRLHLERYEFAATHAADRHVVDCACGTGYGSEILARAGAASVLGVDIDEAAVAFARQQHPHERVSYTVADAAAYEPPLAPEVWVTLETVEHLADPEAYLRATWLRLAPDGLLIASVPTTVSTDGNPFHRTDFTRKSWHRLLATTGFVAEDELVQTHRFKLRQIFGSERGERQRGVRRNLLAYYAAHPAVACARLALTARRGLVHEYTTVVARRTSRPPEGRGMR